MEDESYIRYDQKVEGTEYDPKGPMQKAILPATVVT
jgi:hypothetical protein